MAGYLSSKYMGFVPSKLVRLCVLQLVLIWSVIKCCDCQSQDENHQEPLERPEADCTNYYRNTQRHGVHLMGEIKIPLQKIKNTKLDNGDGNNLSSGSEHGFKLQMKFSRSVRTVNVRQAKAKDIGGSHTEFMIDTTAKDGVMKLDTMVRLLSGRGHLPSVKRIVYNNKVLCGPPLTESELNESVVVNSFNLKNIEATVTSSTKAYRYRNPTRASTSTGLEIQALPSQLQEDDYF